MAMPYMYTAIRNYLLFYLVFITGSMFAQDPANWQMVQVLPVKSKVVQADRMGNFYIVTPTNQLFKYNANFERIATLNYTFSGTIDAVDVSNPLEIYLFYKALNQVVILDNNLAYRGQLNLSDWGVTQAACIGRSFDNGIWVFDLGDFQLKKFDKMGSLIQSSGNCRQYIDANEIIPIACIDDGNKVLLVDQISGIVVFDIFGSFVKKIQIEGVQFLQSEKDILYVLKESVVTELRPGGQRKQVLICTEKDITQFSILNKHILLVQPNQIRRFKHLE
jgi:hypothetical protein